MKTAFIFPGQGAQQVGMGRDLAHNLPEIAQLYDRANEIVGYDLAQLCFEGPEDKLNSTVFSQPALFTTSAACLMALRMGKVAADLSQLQPHACAGLSLGEYTALYAAGAMSFEDGLRLVQLRGKSMQQAADQQPGAMVSLLDMAPDSVNQLCQAVLAEITAEDDGAEPILVPVNFNCPGQIVVSGTIAACRRAAQRAEEFGASRAIPLKVAGAFHTRLMESAAKKLQNALEICNFSLPECPVLANVDGLVYDNVELISQKLLRQLINPVLWQQTVENLLDQKFERFVEIGPGRVLTGLVKKTARLRKARPQMINISGLE
ncbi:ACP S-malonyltransferase [Planctomycetota bacterium]